MRNTVCNVEELEKFNYPKWTLFWDVIRWKIPGLGGDKYLYVYKDAFVRFHRGRIKKLAAIYHIPADLLAGVAWAEAGGMPDSLKSRIFEYRRFDWSGSDWIDQHLTITHPPERTSMGIVAMQIGVAGREIDPKMVRPSITQQIQIKECLMQDAFNLDIVSRHLRNLILYDYPDTDTSKLTNEQFILAGSRYNRGIQRKLQDFIDSIKADVSNVKLRDYSSYGRAILRRRAYIQELLR